MRRPHSADGLTEDVTTDLARFPEFGVIARNSTEVYAGKPGDALAIGAALQVDFVVNGSIQRDGERMRISAQLVDAKTGKTAPTRTSSPFKRKSPSRPPTASVAAPDWSRRLEESPRAEPGRQSDRYELYLLGTQRLEQINPADVEEAIRLLNRAVEIDPRLARAWKELYHSHKVLAGFGVEPEKNLRIASDAAERAVRLDLSDAEAHAVFGKSLGYKNDLVRAEAEFDTALSLAPGAAEILIFYSAWASTFGAPNRGADMVDQVIRLNPNYPMWSANLFLYAYFMAGRYEDALRVMDRMTPDNYLQKTWAMRAGALAAIGRVEESETWVQRALERRPELTIEGMVNQPGCNDAERQRFIDTMRLAGFPSCAKPEARAAIDQPLRLPECESQPGYRSRKNEALPLQRSRAVGFRGFRDPLPGITGSLS